MTKGKKRCVTREKYHGQLEELCKSLLHVGEGSDVDVGRLDSAFANTHDVDAEDVHYLRYVNNSTIGITKVVNADSAVNAESGGHVVRPALGH